MKAAVATRRTGVKFDRKFDHFLPYKSFFFFFKHWFDLVWGTE